MPQIVLAAQVLNTPDQAAFTDCVAGGVMLLGRRSSELSYANPQPISDCSAGLMNAEPTYRPVFLSAMKPKAGLPGARSTPSRLHSSTM